MTSWYALPIGTREHKSSNLICHGNQLSHPKCFSARHLKQIKLFCVHLRFPSELFLFISFLLAFFANQMFYYMCARFIFVIVTLCRWRSEACDPGDFLISRHSLWAKCLPILWFSIFLNAHFMYSLFAVFRNQKSNRYLINPKSTEGLMKLLDTFLLTITCRGNIVLISNSVEQYLGHCRVSLSCLCPPASQIVKSPFDEQPSETSRLDVCIEISSAPSHKFVENHFSPPLE